MTPTQRTLRALRDRGLVAALVKGGAHTSGFMAFGRIYLALSMCWLSKCVHLH